MLRLAKDNDFELVFVRVRRQPGQDGSAPPQSTALKQYIAELDAYLTGHGATLIDFTHDRRIRPTMYGEGDHIALASQQRYTELFCEKLEEVRK